MGKSIGIDLGTTNSVIAVAEGNDCRVLISKGTNQRCTPSVVGLHLRSGEELVGDTALANAGNNPQNTIISVKRLMGRYHDDPEVQRSRERYSYVIGKAADGSADVRVMLGEQELTPTEVSAKILRKLKQDAEARLGEEVTHAVITVPAYFSNLQRICTRDAGQMAGFKVKAIIDEPYAAAIAFGVEHQDAEPKTVLVFDLGGGTFDVSILNLVGDHAFTQLNIEGDMWLGGDDFDHGIVDLIVKHLEKAHGSRLALGPAERLMLKRWAERAKIELSEMSATSVMEIGALPDGRGGRLDVEFDLTRGEFEALVLEERVGRAIEIVRLALRNAELSPDRVDHVLLVGGSSTIPAVQKALEREFGKERILRTLDPMTCVAMGAAIMADRLEGCLCVECKHFNPVEATVCQNAACARPLSAARTCNRCQEQNEPDAACCSKCGLTFRPGILAGGILAKPIGIGMKEDTYEIIVAKNTPYPMLEPVVRRFKTAEATQQSVSIPVYHGDDLGGASANEWLAHVRVQLQGEHLPAGTPVSVAIQVDGDGCLAVQATILGGQGRKAQAWIDPKTPRIPTEPPVSEPAAVSADDSAKWKANLSWSVGFARLVADRYEWLLDHLKIRRLTTLADEGDALLRGNNGAAAAAKESEIDDYINEAMGGLWALAHAEWQCKTRNVDMALENETLAKVKAIIEMIRRNDSADSIVAEIEKLRALVRRVIDGSAVSSGKKDDGTELE